MIIDPIADMLTRIRNGYNAGKEMVEIPASKMKHQISRIMTEEHFLRGYELIELPGNKRVIKTYLRYDDNDAPVLKHIEKSSKIGRRYYVPVTDIPIVRNGLGLAILSTSKGVLTDQQARMLGVGGEVICQMW